MIREKINERRAMTSAIVLSARPVNIVPNVNDRKIRENIRVTRVMRSRQSARNRRRTSTERVVRKDGALYDADDDVGRTMSDGGSGASNGFAFSSWQMVRKAYSARFSSSGLNGG